MAIYCASGRLSLRADSYRVPTSAGTGALGLLDRSRYGLDQRAFQRHYAQSSFKLTSDGRSDTNITFTKLYAHADRDSSDPANLLWPVNRFYGPQGKSGTRPQSGARERFRPIVVTARTTISRISIVPLLARLRAAARGTPQPLASSCEKTFALTRNTGGMQSPPAARDADIPVPYREGNSLSSAAVWADLCRTRATSRPADRMSIKRMTKTPHQRLWAHQATRCGRAVQHKIYNA